MTDILNEIDKAVLDLMPNDGIQFNGLCQLIRKSDQIHPVTILDNRQISIDGQWNALCYHRLLNAAIEPDEIQQFGRKIGRKVTQQVRTFLAARSSKGEGWIYEFCENFPEEINTLSTDYEFIHIGGLTVIEDQQAVYEAEFGENSYEKHAIPWNVYAIEYGIEFIRC